MLYKVGDKVVCVNAGTFRGKKLIEGQTYVVSTGGEYTIRVEGVESYQYAARFKKVDA